MNFRLHPSCGYSIRFVFRQNLKSANSLRSNKRIYNGLALSQTVKNNASGDAVQLKAASKWPFTFAFKFLIFIFAYVFIFIFALPFQLSNRLTFQLSFNLCLCS